MLQIDNKFYTAALRWKKGEMEALRSLDDASKERLLPHIVFPPISARDIEKGRRLSREEYSLVQVGRLQTFWPGRPCLADFRFLQFDSDDRDSDATRISELLSATQEYDCKLIPVLNSHMDNYRMGAVAAHIRKSNCGAAIRIELSDLQSDKLKDMLNTLTASAHISASDSILIVDFADAIISDFTTFSKFTIEWLSKLRHFDRWKRIIVEASSYPTRNPAPPNGETVTPRNEWLSWRHLAQEDRSILGWASFGDFGADHGQIDFKGGGRTITHLRYATPENWIVGRGGEPTPGHDGTIHTVAKRIVRNDEFMGDDYSAGDEFIAQCAEHTSTGNGSTWRWANMVHHMTMATSSVGELIGLPFERPKRALLPKQLSFLTTGK